MALILYTRPAGYVGDEVAGAVTGYGVYPDSKVDTLDSQTWVDAGVAALVMPDDAQIDPMQFVGGYLPTPLSAGTSPATTFTNRANFLSNFVTPPRRHDIEIGDYTPGIKFNGTYWTDSEGKGVGETTAVTITNGGNGYTTGSAITRAITGSGIGLTVTINSTINNGEIDSVTVNTSGISYQTGDTIRVLGGANNAVLTIGSTRKILTGTINTGRGASTQSSADDMNPSYVTLAHNFRNLTEADLELFAVSGNQVIPYDPTLTSPYKFDSFGDCFIGGDYTLQIRIAATSRVIGEVTCPGPQETNSDIDFYIEDI